MGPVKAARNVEQLTAHAVENWGLTDPCFSQQMLGGLSMLREEGLMCDYTLIAEDSAFPVHKALFAAVSDYFHAVFRSGMQEVHRDELTLKGVSASGLRSVVDFVYTGKLNVTVENALDVLMAGSHLQMPAVLKLVSKFYKHNLSLDNIREIENIAVTYHLVELQRVIRDFILENFSKFAKTNYFKELPLSEVSNLVKDNHVKCHSEFRLFRILLEWIYHCPENRESLASNLLKHIRLPYMSPEELKYIRNLPFIAKNGHCIDMLDKAIYFREHPKEQILLRSPSNEVRSEPYIVAFGCNNRAMHACVLYKGEWYPLDRALGQPRPFLHAAATVVNNFLFVCGGQATDAISSCLCFNPCWGKWLPLASMNKPRRSFGLAACDFNLFAIGGVSTNNEVTNTVEVYSIESNRWTFCTPMDVQLADMATCTYGKRIYVAAGVDESCIHVRDFKSYDVTANKWRIQPPILAIKFRPAMFGMKGHLYLLDLYRTEGSPAQLERFDLRAKQWTNYQLHGVHFSRSFGSAMMDQWIYMVGRNDVDEGRSKRYNIKTGQLEDVKAYPWAVEAPLCCVLRLPNKLLMRKMLQECY